MIYRTFIFPDFLGDTLRLFLKPTSSQHAYPKSPLTGVWKPVIWIHPHMTPNHVRYRQVVSFYMVVFADEDLWFIGVFFRGSAESTKIRKHGWKSFRSSGAPAEAPLGYKHVCSKKGEYRGRQQLGKAKLCGKSWKIKGPSNLKAP